LSEISNRSRQNSWRRGIQG